MQTAAAPRNRIAELFWASPPRERANPLRGSGSRPESRAGGRGVPQNPAASHTANLGGAWGAAQAPGTPLSPQGHKVTGHTQPPAIGHPPATPSGPPAGCEGVPGWAPGPCQPGRRPAAGCGCRQGHGGPTAPPSHTGQLGGTPGAPGLVRAAHSHDGGGRGLTGPPQARGKGRGPARFRGPRERGVAVVTEREPSAESGEPQVRDPQPHRAPEGSRRGAARSPRGGRASRTVGEGLQDHSGAGEPPGPGVRGCRCPAGRENARDIR